MKFRMIDQIVAWERHRSIRGVKAVSFEEYGMKAQGDVERLPESLVLESVCQLAGWLMILSSDFAIMGDMAGFERAEFRSFLRPAERMELSVHVCESCGEWMLVDAAGQSRGRDVMQIKGLRMRRLSIAEYQDADDLRVLFSEIHRPDTAGSA